MVEKRESDRAIPCVVERWILLHRWLDTTVQAYTLTNRKSVAAQGGRWINTVSGRLGTWDQLPVASSGKVRQGMEFWRERRNQHSRECWGQHGGGRCLVPTEQPCPPGTHLPILTYHSSCKSVNSDQQPWLKGKCYGKEFVLSQILVFIGRHSTQVQVCPLMHSWKG